MFLPTETRRAIIAFYTLCRELDDIVDECQNTGVAAAKLDWWRQEVVRMSEGTAQHPVARALMDTAKGRALPQTLLLEIIDGMAMDLVYQRYPDFQTLRLYCYRAASVVGELAAQIFGYHNPATRDYAHDLGLAFQLTNIIRDVGEDARRGRIYLPQQELAQFEVSEADILASRPTVAFQRLMQFQYQRADAFYAKALGELPTIDRKAQRPGLAMAAIYRALLIEIKRAEFPVLQARISLTPVRKLWLASKTWIAP